MIGRHYKTRNIYPAQYWQDATLSGNGVMSALVYGGAYAEKILINNEKWWYKGVRDELPDISSGLAEVRRLMDKGEYSAAQDVYPSLLQKSGYNGAPAFYQPGIDLRIVTDLHGEFRDYERTLDMSTGEVSVSFSDDANAYSRRLFVSRSDGALIQRITAAEPFTVKIFLEPHDIFEACGLFGDTFVHGLSFSCRINGDIVISKETVTRGQAAGSSRQRCESFIREKDRA